MADRTFDLTGLGEDERGEIKEINPDRCIEKITRCESKLEDLIKEANDTFKKDSLYFKNDCPSFKERLDEITFHNMPTISKETLDKLKEMAEKNKRAISEMMMISTPCGEETIFKKCLHDNTKEFFDFETVRVFERLQKKAFNTANEKGWHDTPCNDGEQIALMHSELSEALEALRENLVSDKIPAFQGVEEELADVLIRILHYAERKKLRVVQAMLAKMEYNDTRPFKHGNKLF